MAYSQQLKNQLNTAFKAKGENYLPRTHHLQNNGQPIYINRLILEDSPYLLQHAHNPVDWYPWGDEAFAVAIEQNKPIFLSIGYATCHWCHVMEEQSFENITVADFLNQYFISLKVDREQHPDIDAAYMTAVTMFSGHGGWPMSSFLTPEGKPFYGGTYYPQASFLHLLSQINDAWHNQRETLLQQAEQLAYAVKQTSTQNQQIVKLEQSVLQSATNTALSNYDSRFGGFSAAPKFPQEPLLLLLLQSLQRQSNPSLFEAVEHTLTAMAQGGIYDQVGGGFHRYSVDNHWLVPHFEKMLYNQAYLSRVYLYAYRLNHNPLHARIVTQTLDYVLREMRNHDGVFYSATDADSEGHEGTYFVWTVDEIKQLLSPEEARFIIELFAVTHQGNFEGKNILFLPRSLTAVSIEHQQSLKELCQRLDPLLVIMRQHRQQRVAPLTDDKILLAWNSMIITALAEAGHWLNESRYIKAAEQAAASLWQSQRPKDSVLWRVNLNGQVSVAARQDDYVHFAEALLALFDVTDNKVYCQQAQQLAKEMLDKFLDNTSGALRMSNEKLLFTRPKDTYDGALPSGNAVAVRVFSRLAQRTGQKIFQDHAIKILQTYSNNITQQPLAYAYMLAQLDELNRGEIADYQYAAGGAIKISTQMNRIDDNRYLVIMNFNMPKGWYFNKETMVTVLNKDSWTLNQVKENPDNFELKINLALANNLNYTPLKIHLNIHPCSHDKCLAVEDIDLYIERS